MAILQTRELKKYYGAGDTLVKALDGVELSVENGEFVAIIGTSGSGKSTLLHMLGGLDRPTSGTVTVDGRELSTLKDEELTIFRRRKIGFVFQAYNLVPVLSVYENIVLPIQLDGGAVDESYVREVIAVLGLEKKLDSLPGQLSGGQQQRVAIARALVKRPDILLLDEPLSNLDARLRLEMREEIRRIQTETGVTTVFVTHDQEEAMSITDEIVLMRTGVVQQQCPPQQMYLNPANRFVAGFLGNPPINFFRLDVCGGTVCLAEDYMLRVHGAADGPVLVGIRPEAWRLGQGLRTAAEAVEMRGKDLLVTFSLAGERARAILDITAGVAAGDAVELTLEPRLVYIFDPETGARLDAEVAG